MKTMVKRTLAATALATVALAGAATTATTTASASTGRSSGVVQPNCGGPNGGCTYYRYELPFTTFDQCNYEGEVLEYLDGWADYFCTRDDNRGEGPWALFYTYDT
jgi:hypothetical protein